MDVKSHEGLLISFVFSVQDSSENLRSSVQSADDL
jgi:hypothetical protein